MFREMKGKGINTKLKIRVGMLSARLNATRRLRFLSSTSGAKNVLRHVSLQK